MGSRRKDIHLPTELNWKAILRYRRWWNWNRSSNGAGTSCGPQWIFDRGVTAYYSIYLPDGGHTTQELRVNVFEVGESVT